MLWRLHSGPLPLCMCTGIMVSLMDVGPRLGMIRVGWLVSKRLVRRLDVVSGVWIVIALIWWVLMWAPWCLPLCLRIRHCILEIEVVLSICRGHGDRSRAEVDTWAQVATRLETKVGLRWRCGNLSKHGYEHQDTKN